MDLLLKLRLRLANLLENAREVRRALKPAVPTLPRARCACGRPTPPRGARSTRPTLVSLLLTELKAFEAQGGRGRDRFLRVIRRLPARSPLKRPPGRVAATAAAQMTLGP